MPVKISYTVLVISKGMNPEFLFKKKSFLCDIS